MTRILLARVRSRGYTMSMRRFLLLAGVLALTGAVTIAPRRGRSSEERPSAPAPAPQAQPSASPRARVGIAPRQPSAVAPPAPAWTRPWGGYWWWYEPGFGRWNYWYAGHWWWHGPAGATFIYMNDGYYPYAGSPAPAAPASGAGGAWTSPDGTRVVEVTGADAQAVLYEKNGQEMIYRGFLGKEVQRARFSAATAQSAATILIEFRDGTFALFDHAGRRVDEALPPAPETAPPKGAVPAPPPPDALPPAPPPAP